MQGPWPVSGSVLKVSRSRSLVKSSWDRIGGKLVWHVPNRGCSRISGYFEKEIASVGKEGNILIF
jgi:hypothetical protein